MTNIFLPPLPWVEENAPPTSPAMRPTAPPFKPTLIDRVFARMFPAGASPFGGLLSPEQLSAARRQAALRVAGTLLAEGGPRPRGTSGVFEGVGKALGAANWPQELQQAGMQAAQINQFQQADERRQALENVVNEYPPAPNETPKDTATRINQMLGDIVRIGGPEAASFAELLTTQMRGLATAEDIGKPPEPLVPPGTLHANAQSRLLPWERTYQAVQKYGLFRNAPLDEGNSRALLEAANELLGTTGGFPEESSAMANAPVFGSLFKFLKSLTGQERLTAAQRDELVAATDQVVALLGRGYADTRNDVERLMGPAFRPEIIPQLLPRRLTWPTFRPGARRAAPIVPPENDPGAPRDEQGRLIPPYSRGRP